MTLREATFGLYASFRRKPESVTKRLPWLAGRSPGIVLAAE